MLATISSSTLSGVDGHPVSVEVHVADGLPGFSIVGLPDASCREARDRVRAAIVSSGAIWPLKRITVNLAPGGVPKIGAGLDLPIALGVLTASGQLPSLDGGIAAFGELGLDGSVRSVPGAVSLADAATGRWVLVPAGDAAVAALVAGDRVRAVRTLADVAAALVDGLPWPDGEPPSPTGDPAPPPDLADVRAAAAQSRLVPQQEAIICCSSSPGAGDAAADSRPSSRPVRSGCTGVLRVPSASASPSHRAGWLIGPRFELLTIRPRWRRWLGEGLAMPAPAR